VITVTLPWWGWLLWICGLIAVSRISAWLGDRLGHVTYRWYIRRKTQRALRDTLKA
jgi:hypothetical protein